MRLGSGGSTAVEWRLLEALGGTTSTQELCRRRKHLDPDRWILPKAFATWNKINRGRFAMNKLDKLSTNDSRKAIGGDG